MFSYHKREHTRQRHVGAVNQPLSVWGPIPASLVGDLRLGDLERPRFLMDQMRQ
jgi:hypothetical protein